MSLFGRRADNTLIQDAVPVGMELSVPIKDLQRCLYEEYQKVDLLRQENESMKERLKELESLQTEQTTSLVVIDQLKQELKREQSKVTSRESDIEHYRNQIKNLKAEAADYRRYKEKVRSLDEVLEVIIKDIEDNYTNIGRRQVITLLQGYMSVSSDCAAAVANE